MTKLISRGRALAADRKGVTALEYGLIASVIALGLLAVVPAFSTALNAVFTRASTALAPKP